MEDGQPFRILSLDGGGARGIYPAQVLSRIEPTYDVKIRDCFDLIVGTSTGSILAGAAATAIPMDTVVNLFDAHAQRIFKKSLLRPGLFRSRYSTKPLEKVIRTYIPETTLGNLSAALMITSSDISTGGVHVFKSCYLMDLGETYVRDRDVLLSDAILASCAAPTYFDPSTVGQYLLADGGLWANNPSIIAVTEAISKFDKDIREIQVLSIGTGRVREMYTKRKSWGFLTGWGNKKLISCLLNVQSQASSNMASLLLKEQYLRLDPEIGDWDLDDTRHLDNLKALADRDFTHAHDVIRSHMRTPVL